MMSDTKPTNYRKLLLIFIHGFKGDDHTFKNFPERLQQVLTNAVQSVEAESIIYPRYETRGDLKKAVEMFCIWLDNIVEEKEKEVQGKGDVWVCLISHSMGGILAADAILKYKNQTEYPSPKFVGLLAFDTPYFGLNNDDLKEAAYWQAVKYKQTASGVYELLSKTGGFFAFSQTTTKAVENVKNQPAHSSSGWGKFGIATGFVAGAAAVAAAYYTKDSISQFLGSHFEFVSTLINPELSELEARVKNLIQIKDVHFRCYYIEIPPGGQYRRTRTFINLPKSDFEPYFSALTSMNQDVIDAHISIFNPDQTNGLDGIALKEIIEIVIKYEKDEQTVAS